MLTGLARDLAKVLVTSSPSQPPVTSAQGDVVLPGFPGRKAQRYLEIQMNNKKNRGSHLKSNFMTLNTLSNIRGSKKCQEWIG